MRKHFTSWLVIGVLWLAALACSNPIANNPKGEGDYIVKKFEFEEQGVTIQTTGYIDNGYFYIVGVITNTSGKAYDIWIGVDLWANGKSLGNTSLGGTADGVTPLGGISPADTDNTFYYLYELPAGQVPDDYKLALRAPPQTMRSCVYKVTDWDAREKDGNLIVMGSISESCKCDDLYVAPEIWNGDYLVNAHEMIPTVTNGKFEVELVKELEYLPGMKVKNVRAGCFVLP